MREQNLRANLERRVLEKFQDSYSTTGSGINRMIQLKNAPKIWKVPKDEEKMDEINNIIWQTRDCFQNTSNEWTRTSMNQKVELLSQLKKDYGLGTLELALRVMDIGNNEHNKDIAELDLILSMSEIIDFLLKEKND